jgi:hypothetical protein
LNELSRSLSRTATCFMPTVESSRNPSFVRLARVAKKSYQPAWVKRSVSRTSYRSNVEREARVKSDDGKSP